MTPATRPITIHTVIGAADPLEIRSGPSIPPIERIKLFSANQWEACVDEWASSLPGYGLVERAGGAGDMGCDVVATVDPVITGGDWDNYQCKHYDHPLAPGDIWIELGKLCYFTFTGAYTMPRRYSFVAPRGVGTKLMRLLKRPDDLRAGLIANWTDKCANDISKTACLKLEGPLLEHLMEMDFHRVGHLPPLELIEGLRSTPYFAVRFGLGLPKRDPSPPPPTSIAPGESRYVSQLLNAYGDNAKTTFARPDVISPNYRAHFQRSRESFYCAEALRSFSRDTLPVGAFENLQDQIHNGIIAAAYAISSPMTTV